MVVVFFGLVLMVLGVIGEYLGKIILILNNTPQFIVRDTVNAGNAQERLKALVRETTEAPEPKV